MAYGNVLVLHRDIFEYEARRKPPDYDATHENDSMKALRIFNHSILMSLELFAIKENNGSYTILKNRWGAQTHMDADVFQALFDKSQRLIVTS